MKTVTPKNSTTLAAEPVNLPVVNLTGTCPPPADSKVRIISHQGQTISAIVIPKNWTDPPHDVCRHPNPQDPAGHSLESQLRGDGLTDFEFHEYLLPP